MEKELRARQILEVLIKKSLYTLKYYKCNTNVNLKQIIYTIVQKF